MLNISPNRIQGKIDTKQYESFSMLKDYRAGKIATRILLTSLFVFIIVLFLPWTQNIRSKGYVTTLYPEQRPQNIHSVIAGRIEKWFVSEGDLVRKGDTLLFISEVKDEYFDPELLGRTEEQIKAKELSVKSYMEKVKALDNQIDALINSKRLKLEQAGNKIKQAELKIQSDSMNLEASILQVKIADDQFKRIKNLHEQGLKSLTDLEKRKLKLQENQAKVISLKNKLLSSKNELINAKVELGAIENDYSNKLAKSESDKYEALSKMYNAEAVVTKMQSQFMNYSIRSGLYYITAPQDGYITKAIQSGIGITVKAGDQLVSVMPYKYDLAVAMYINPTDLPLIQRGQEIRFMFDGWPSIVFSGWPNLSHGTFGGKVSAIDNFISENGKYRILVAPNPDDKPWPDALRVGSGANGLALLKDVPIWYELWRNLNGFPPDYYKIETSKMEKKK